MRIEISNAAAIATRSDTHLISEYSYMKENETIAGRSCRSSDFCEIGVIFARLAGSRGARTSNLRSVVEAGAG